MKTKVYGTPEWRTYHHMKGRCLNPNFKQFFQYGGRGITICARWLGKDGFRNFFSDMGARPPGCSLDRIDNDGNYCPENCRWATRKQQQQNTRRNHFVTLNGETMCAQEASRRTGMHPSLIAYRARHGIPLETPLRELWDKRKIVVVHNGKKMFATDAAKLLGISRETVIRRFRAGVPLDAPIAPGKPYRAMEATSA